MARDQFAVRQTKTGTTSKLGISGELLKDKSEACIRFPEWNDKLARTLVKEEVVEGNDCLKNNLFDKLNAYLSWVSQCGNCVHFRFVVAESGADSSRERVRIGAQTL